MSFLSTGGLNDSERRGAEQSLGSSCTCHCTAVARLYVASGTQWTYNGNMGAIVVCSDKNFGGSYFLRMVDLKSMSVVYEQEFYNNFLYTAPRPYFHAFESDRDVMGISFADQQEAQKFFSSVVTCKTKTVAPVGTPVATRRVNPESIPDAETPKQRKLREKKEREREKGRQKLQRSKGRAMVIEGPTNVTHVSHIGWDPRDGFQIRNIPTEWKKLFKDAGIKKSDLKNPETAAFIYSTVQSAMMSGVAAPNMGYVPPPPPAAARVRSPVVTKRTQAPYVSRQPAQSESPSFYQTQDTPFYQPSYTEDTSYSNGYNQNGYDQNGYGEGDNYASGNEPPPPPPPPQEASGGSQSGLLMALSAAKLKKVEVSEQETPAYSTGPSLLQTLSSAMAQRRIDIKEDEAGDGEDNWSDEWSDEE